MINPNGVELAGKGGVNAVQNELNADRGQHQTHQTAQDPEANNAQAGGFSDGIAQNQINEDAHDEDIRHEDDLFLDEVGPLIEDDDGLICISCKRRFDVSESSPPSDEEEEE